MIVLITGGSASGKSEYGENLAVKLSKAEKKTYIATMYPYGDETLQKIQRHKEMRKGKGFETLECFCGLKNIDTNNSTVLLECMSNLLANELYREEGAKDKALEEIMTGIQKLGKETVNLIIISNEVFGDITASNSEMLEYIRLLGRINLEIGKMADVICEVVYSIPIFHKGVIK
ncbi:adenosylcobinamide kinase /adenosylcobinamide-phosphate guanylyltransferase [Lachnotalea glycerini]|jgi:adenosylcobinamide kinase / adenosylcobinamide-phosphate guanylyltransferase|uniref:Adenosylcobinamide kinase n=1 Tax=Lachnotalea glycerini TaxID=1763509 RepID=A0A255MUJ9_9FIRM|nr:bifunctional adenosylcobinamide kinase/adenosylcobinamide-phosphate guanylyltransferase [Lachnotalea glycerini]OYO92499.1 cobalamin biosynthesis protein [Lachnotalea glycerini]PXV95809.1 adenosylcobinamide kinase /adenosylcobinamide-phosphate guanylyltransferase [Lachnotalea glycerini]RDY33128.1 bifunctional adenosylcobinamide kinase/adenosylcobinamide-phosphate guanylyltransferase [Lachnotalea glycerini]